MKDSSHVFLPLTRRRLLKHSAVLFAAGVNGNRLFGSPEEGSKMYLCQDSCCVDIFFTSPEDRWFEKGEAPPSGLQPCSCGYFLEYRIHDCPGPDKNWNLLMTERHRLYGSYVFEGERCPIYSCNGLPPGWEDIDVTQSDHDQLLEAVRELEELRWRLKYQHL